MAEVVDSIVADLMVKYEQYVAGFDKATAAHDRFTKSVPKISGFDGIKGIDAAEAQKYVDRHTKAAGDVAKVEEQATAKVTRTRKARTDASVQADKAEVASAKVSAKAKADVEIAEAQRSARFRAVAERAAGRSVVLQSDGRNLGVSVPRTGSTQASIPASVINGGASAEVAAEAEVNHLLVERAKLQDAATYSSKADNAVIREKLAELTLIDRLQKQGRTDAEIALALDERALAIEARRTVIATEQAAAQRKQALAQITKFGEAAGIGRTSGSGAAVGGLLVGAVAGGAVSAVVAATKEGLEYARSLKTVSDQLGITTKSLQVYETASSQIGVSQEQLRESLGQVGSNLGKAQEGSEQQQKIFKALNIDIGNAREGYKTLGDVLPTLVSRLSGIGDQTRRNAIETALGGEQLRKLDPILSGGTASLDELSDALERTGAILSDSQIRQAAKVSDDLKRLGDQLERQLAGVVSQNASAIEQLATSFFNAASKGLQLLSVLQRFGALKSGTQDGRDFLNNTPEGRQQFLQSNSNSLKALRTIGNDGGQSGIGSFVINGVGDVKNTPEGIAAARATLLGQRRKTLVAAAADNAVSNPASVQPGKAGNTDDLFAPKPKKGRKGKSAEQLEKEADQRQKRYEDELAQINDQYLSAQRDLTVGAEARLALDEASLQQEHDRRESDIQREANEKRIDQSKVQELQAANDKLLAERRAVLALQHQVELENSANDLRQQGYDTYLGRLRDEESLATTAKERRRLALRELAVERDAETDRLNATIHSKNPNVSDSDRAKAQDLLDSQPERYESKGNSTLANTRGPLEGYLASLPRTAEKVDEALQQAAVNGLQNLNDGLSTAVDKFLHLHGIAGQFLSGLIKIGIERELLIPLANSLFPTQSGTASGGGGGFLSSVVGSVLGAVGIGAGGGQSSAATAAAAFSLPGFAAGGSGVISGRTGVDQNTLSLNGNPIARVGHGELLSVSPNVAATNVRASSQPAQSIVVVQPIHADFSGARTDEQTMRQFTAYADARSAQAYKAAVQTAGSQVSGIIGRKQTLGS